MFTLIDLTGMIFGDYTVIERDLSVIGLYRGSRQYKWICRCRCGNIVSVQGGNLSRSKAGCKKCSTLAQRKNIIGEIPTHYWLDITNSAKARGHEFSVTPEQTWQKYLDQNGQCALSGLSIGFRDCGKSHNRNYAKHTASLDRIDSNLGYVPKNIQWVHKSINLMKNRLDERKFIAFCCAVAKHSASQVSGDGGG
jgi:hypothetical protein